MGPLSNTAPPPQCEGPRVIRLTSRQGREAEKARFLEAVALGLADAEACRTMETKDLLRRLEERRSAGHQP